MQRFDDEPIRSEEELVRAVERHLAHMGAYASWTVGVAADPDARYAGLGQPASWAHWRAASEAIARGAAQRLVAKGMHQDHSEQPKPLYVYIF